MLNFPFESEKAFLQEPFFNENDGNETEQSSSSSSSSSIGQEVEELCKWKM